GANPLFGTAIEAGWSGGHGTAAGMAEVYNNLNWAEGTSIALTIATIGLVFGVVSGVIIINYAVRKGYTKYIDKSDTLATANEPDIIAIEKQEDSTKTTIKNEVINSFAFHSTIILIAIIIGWMLKYVVDIVVPGIPLFPLAMIGGLIVGMILKRTTLYDAIDLNTFRTIQSFALDFLIVAAVASMQLPVVVEYFWPLVIVSLVTFAFMIFYFFYLGPRLFKKDWFE